MATRYTVLLGLAFVAGHCGGEPSPMPARETDADTESSPVDDTDSAPQNTDDETDPDAGPPFFSDLDTEQSASVRTVIAVRFSTDIATTAHIAYGLTESLGQQTPPETGSSIDHEILLLGLAPNTRYFFQLVADLDGETRKSALYTVETGGIDIGLPHIIQTGSGIDGFVIVPLIGATTAVTVLNGAGQIVWYHIEDRALDTYRARLARDGSGIIYNAASVSGDISDQSEIVRVSFDGAQKTAVSIPLLAHDFVEHDDGTLAAIVSEYRPFKDRTLRGEHILEVAPDGSERVVWTSWDCFDPETDTGDNLETGWTFANALNYVSKENAYYIGMRNFSSIAKVDRETGACLWVLGNTAETLTFTADSDRFLHQHQFDVLDDGILVFDNEGSAGTISRVIEYSLDFTRNQAEEVWQYTPDDPIYTFVLGEPTRLSNGDTFINWSVAGEMQRVTKAGKVLWQINTPMGYAFGFHTLEPTLYR